MEVLINTSRLLLSDVLGNGGAATVYAHPSRQDLAIKTYRDPELCEPERIHWLCNHRPPNLWERGQPTFAWPIEPAFDACTGNMCGFSMPRVCHALPFQAIVSPSSRSSAIQPRWLWKVAISFLRRLHTLHLLGHIAGDINLENAVVDRRGIVTELDLDSTHFLIPGGPTFTTPMNRVELQPAELIGARNPVLDRGQDQDAYSAAIMVSRLLQEGRHPFTCNYLGAGTQPKLHERMRDGIWPDSLRHPLFQPAPCAVPFSALPAALRAILVRMFVDGHTNRAARPTITELLTCLMQNQPFGTHYSQIGSLAWRQDVSHRSAREYWRAGAAKITRHKGKVAIAACLLLGYGAELCETHFLDHPPAAAPIPSLRRAQTSANTNDTLTGRGHSPATRGSVNQVLLPTPKLWREATNHRR